MSPQRVIRTGARRTSSGSASLPWLAAASALPVVVTALVLTAITLAVLVFSPLGPGHLFPVVAVEWLVVTHAPLSVDSVELGVLPLLPPLLYVAVLARQARSTLADVERPGGREIAAVLAGATAASLAVTGLAVVLVGSAQSDFAVRERSVPEALIWSAVVTLSGTALGLWLHLRRDLRAVLPDWVRGGVHLGTAFAAVTWALGTLLVLVSLLGAWSRVGETLAIGKGFWGEFSLGMISIGYLPNAVLEAATVALGGEAHVGEASYSLFSVSPGWLPEIPLASAFPATTPHWAFQGLLLVVAVAAALLGRAVAHWYGRIGDGVRAAGVAAVVVALFTAVTPLVAGGTLGALGRVGTGALIASAVAFLVFGVIGAATTALALSGLTRRRERERETLERRRRRLAERDGRPVADAAGTAEGVSPEGGEEEDDDMSDGIRGNDELGSYHPDDAAEGDGNPETDVYNDDAWDDALLDEEDGPAADDVGAEPDPVEVGGDPASGDLADRASDGEDGGSLAEDSVTAADLDGDSEGDPDAAPRGGGSHLSVVDDDESGEGRDRRDD